jgi:hypothetical protein
MISKLSCGVSSSISSSVSLDTHDDDEDDEEEPESDSLSPELSSLEAVELLLLASVELSSLSFSESLPDAEE